VLARQCAASVTPVREAVVILIGEGLVTALPNKRREVAHLSTATAVQVIDGLSLVLTGVVSRISTITDSALRRQMHALASQQTNLVRGGDFDQCRVNFHMFVRVLTSKLGNPEVIAVVDSFLARSHHLFAAHTYSRLWAISADGMANLARAFDADADAAAAAIEVMFGACMDEIRTLN
jgi:DNA-binding GntR family transcriptional regulator